MIKRSLVAGMALAALLAAGLMVTADEAPPLPAPMPPPPEAGKDKPGDKEKPKDEARPNKQRPGRLAEGRELTPEMKEEMERYMKERMEIMSGTKEIMKKLAAALKDKNPADLKPEDIEKLLEPNSQELKDLAVKLYEADVKHDEKMLELKKASKDKMIEMFVKNTTATLMNRLEARGQKEGDRPRQEKGKIEGKERETSPATKEREVF